jgi:hypothetical protein
VAEGEPREDDDVQRWGVGVGVHLRACVPAREAEVGRDDVRRVTGSLLTGGEWS